MEPNRETGVEHPHADHARDLRSGIRTQDQNPPRRAVHNLVAFLDEFRVEARGQHVEVFEGRRDHFPVTAFCEYREQGGFERALLGRGSRKKGRNAFRHLRARGDIHHKTPAMLLQTNKLDRKDVLGDGNGS